MLALARIIIGAVGLMVGGFLVINSLNVLRAHINDWPLLAIQAAVLLPIVFFALWFALFGHIPEERAKIGFALRTGVIVAFIFLVAGFFGPIILSPASNQGPLFGIFISGPGGFLLGCIVGFIRARLITERSIEG